MKRCLARKFGGETPRVPSAVRKDTCLTIYLVLLGCYHIFESLLIIQFHDPKSLRQKRQENIIALLIFSIGLVIASASTI